MDFPHLFINESAQKILTDQAEKEFLRQLQTKISFEEKNEFFKKILDILSNNEKNDLKSIMLDKLFSSNTENYNKLENEIRDFKFTLKQNSKELHIF